MISKRKLINEIENQFKNLYTEIDYIKSNIQGCFDMYAKLRKEVDGLIEVICAQQEQISEMYEELGKSQEQIQILTNIVVAHLDELEDRVRKAQGTVLTPSEYVAEPQLEVAKSKELYDEEYWERFMEEEQRKLMNRYSQIMSGGNSSTSGRI